MTEPTNQPAAELLPCPFCGKRMICCGLDQPHWQQWWEHEDRHDGSICPLKNQTISDSSEVYKAAWNTRHQLLDARERAREIVGTVFDNTDASHETLKETVIDRIAAALTTTPAASGPLACTECPYVFTEAEIAAEDKKAWGHPCHGVKDQPDAFCESFRELVLDTSISAAIAVVEKLRVNIDAEPESNGYESALNDVLQQLRTLQPSTPSELVDQGRE